MGKYFVSRKLLIETAGELVEEVGAEKATLREVARRAGVTHSAPRHQFATWAALLGAVAQNVALQLDRELEYSWISEVEPREVLLDAARAYVGFARRRPAAFALTQRLDLLGTERDDARKAMRLWVPEVRRNLEIAGARHDEAAAFSLWSTIHGMAVLEASGARDAVIRREAETAEALALAVDRALADRALADRALADRALAEPEAGGEAGRGAPAGRADERAAGART